MSRIHEALRRASGGGEAVQANLREQAVFQSAWSGPGAEESAAPTELMRPMSAPAPVSLAVKGFAYEWRERLATAPEGNSALIEQFRRLAGTLHHAQTASGIRTVMVTSAVPDDGKTLTAVNLALVLSESYRRKVLLVDADLRRPSIPHVVDLSDGVGLSETLRATSEQKLALVQLTSRLTLLPAGQPIPDPIGVLTSARMRSILDEAATHFDWVILDAPPVGPLADASLLADMVDGTLFVIRAGHTQHSHIQKAIEAVGRERILGVVLNGVENMPYQAYDKYYHDGQDGRRRKGEAQ